MSLLPSALLQSPRPYVHSGWWCLFQPDCQMDVFWFRPARQSDVMMNSPVMMKGLGQDYETTYD